MSRLARTVPPIALVGATLASGGVASASDTEITPTAQVQVWLTAHDFDEDPQADGGGYGDPELDRGVSLNRARLGLEGSHDQMSFGLEVGASAPYDTWFAENEPEDDVEVVHAYLAGTPEIGAGTLRLSAGMEKAPFSREALISSRDLLFQERSVATAHLAPGHDLGVMADLDTSAGVRARLGAFNGGGGLFGDQDDGMIGAARVEFANGDAYTTVVDDDGAFGVGASVLYGSDTATSELGLGADLLARIGSVAILIEASRMTIAPTAGTTEALPAVFDVTNRFGLTSQLSYTVKTDRGGIEIGTRYSLYDDAAHSSDNGDVGVLHGGLTWRDAMAGVDVGGGYIHRFEHGGRGISNDSIRLWAQVQYPPPGRD